MLSKANMYKYQRIGTEHIIEHPAAGLLFDMGLGKTVCSLTAVDELRFDRLEISKTLVIAPKLVALATWTNEVKNWEHLKDLRVSVVTGTEKQRIAALNTKADIYTINRENVYWLVKYYDQPKNFPFDMVVIDELSSFKSPSAKRFKALRKVRPYIKRVVGLTGTFNPNGYLDVWAQMYLLDEGKRLFKRYTEYRDTYFKAGRRNGVVIYDYVLKKGADKEIADKVSDICISMKSEDYLELPERIYHTTKVKLSRAQMKEYHTFVKEKILEIKDGTITVDSAGVLSNKLLQYANGAIYDENHEWHEVHRAKLDALYELVEASTSPVMVAYAYQHDLERIKECLKEFKPKTLDSPEDIEKWNAGKIKVLLVHPASAAHGHNLQFGGHTIVWFGNTFNLEHYLQLNKRLHRNGQQHPVLIYHLITEGTHDEDVLTAIERKEAGQIVLMNLLKKRINEENNS